MNLKVYKKEYFLCVLKLGIHFFKNVLFWTNSSLQKSCKIVLIFKEGSPHTKQCLQKVKLKSGPRTLPVKILVHLWPLVDSHPQLLPSRETYCAEQWNGGNNSSLYATQILHRSMKCFVFIKIFPKC